MKILEFTFMGEQYKVNEKGHIKTNKLDTFSKNWIFLGGSKHHWRKGIDVYLNDAFNNPEKLNGCLGWDIDHGTYRQWCGRYFGKLPRIRHAFVEENDNETY